MRNFIWDGNLEKKKVVIVAWKTCYKSLKEGGLGLKSLKTFNEASTYVGNFIKLKISKDFQ